MSNRDRPRLRRVELGGQAIRGQQHAAWLIIRMRGRRYRVFGAWGCPPGSHIGIWKTDTGRVGGWNLRVGRRYIGPCLTVFAHGGPDERS